MSFAQITCNFSWESRLRAMERYLPYVITQCYLPLATGELNVPRLNSSQTGWYSIYLPQRDRRLS